MRLLLPMLLSSFGGFTQSIDTLMVCQDKNVYVVFDHDVSLVDLGSKQDYAFQIKDNIVMLKGLRPLAPPTSLMVKTINAEIYVWIIVYRPALKTILVTATRREDQLPARNADEPQGAVDSLAKNAAIVPDKKPVTATTSQPLTGLLAEREKSGNRNGNVSDAKVGEKIRRMLADKKSFRDLGEIGNGIYFSLVNLAVDERYVYIRLSLHNTSSIAFDLDDMYFERNQGKGLKKREARMRNHMPPVFRESVRTVHPSAEETMVYVLELFAFHERDKLLVKVNERGGVRSLQFQIPATAIIHAKSI